MDTPLVTGQAIPQGTVSPPPASEQPTQPGQTQTQPVQTTQQNPAALPNQNASPPGPENSAIGMNVNFIREQRRRSEQIVEKDKVLARYTSYGLVAFLIVFMAILVTHFVLSRAQAALLGDIDNVKAQLSSMSQIERAYVVYARKVQLLHAFDTAKQVKEDATEFFYELIPVENVLKEVRTEEDSTIISFQILSPDVFSVLNLLRIFSGTAITDLGYSITVDKLSRMPDGTYTLQGSLDYKLATQPQGGGT